MASEDNRREQAVRNIKRRRGLVSHVLSFIVVNIIMVVIWYATGRGYFWPEWVLLGTGIFLVVDVVRTYRLSPSDISEEDIRREIDKMAAA
jgi:hypothetical protein